MIVLEILALTSLLCWIGLGLDRSRRWPAEMRLAASEGAGAGPGAHRARPESLVAAVIPARDEADMIVETLPPLLEQPELIRIYLVDDHSADGTAAATSAVTATSGSASALRVVAAREAPAGWMGKVNAIASGLDALEADPAGAGCEWILFTDADIRHRAHSVRDLLAKASEGYDLVSVMARLSVASLWERLLVPSFVFFFQLLYPFRKVARRHSGVAAAAGGCVLVRREVLERTGGIEAIRGAVIDDVALAKVVSAAGGRLWLGLDPGIRSLRPYPRLADLWAMVSRSAYDQLGYRPALLLAVFVGLALCFVAPAILAPIGVVAALGGQPEAWRTVLWSVVTLALQARALNPAVRHHGLPARFALALPVAGLLFGGMTIWSAWAHHSGRGVGWRGRKVGG